MTKAKYIWILIAILTISSNLTSIAQNTESEPNYQTMSLEQMRQLTYDDFLQIPFEELIALTKRFKVSSIDELYNMILNPSQSTASKLEEDLFDAPLATTVINAAELENSGARNIPEALRLAPGIIVREKTNGNYDIHIRGNDFMPPGSNISKSVNSTTLVMIDNRPVYNKFIGTTFWENLPVSIHDLEKIEIIYGPATALYGPNAVSGVIHLITKTPDKEGWHSTVNLQGGNNNSQLAQGSLMYSKDKVSLSFSGNYDRLDRFQKDYYLMEQNKMVSIQKARDYVDDNNRFFNANEFLDDASRGVKKHGLNVGFNYQPSSKTSLTYSGSYQQSWAQTSYIDMGSVLSSRKSESFSNNVKFKSGKFEAQVSNLNGHLNALKGAYGYEYDITEVNAQVGFNLNYKNLKIRPGIESEYAKYSDEDYIDPVAKNGLLNGSVDYGTYQGSLRLDYSFLKKLRVTGALLHGYFTTNKKSFTSYQFSSSYKLNESTMLRAVASKANTSPTIVDAFMNRSAIIEDDEEPDFLFKYIESGNKKLKQQQMNMLEFGLRKKIGRKLMADVSVFYNRSKNFNLHKEEQFNLVDGEKPTITFETKAHNLKLTSKQFGVTAHLKYVHNEKLNASLFATYQDTKLYDYQITNETAYEALLGKKPDNTTFTGLVTADIKHQYTPKFFGGGYINYKPTKKWNINTSVYASSKQKTFYDLGDEFIWIKIKAKVSCNLKASYQVNSWLSTFVNLRNITNTKAREFMFTDNTKASYLAGCKLTF